MRAHYRTIIENLCQDSIANTRRIERLEAENFQMRVKVATLEGMCEGLLDRTKRLEGAEAWVKEAMSACDPESEAYKCADGIRMRMNFAAGDFSDLEKK